MRRIVWLIGGALMGAAGMWVSMNYHVLRTDHGFTWVPKYRAQLTGTYVDVRDWGVTEWTEHPELAVSLQQNGRSDILGDTKVLGTSLRDALDLVK